MKRSKIEAVIVDYEMGNLFSLERVITHLGGSPVISSNPQIIRSAERLILPGVGAFGDGIGNLRKKQLVEPLREFVNSGKPLLGICLGMQLFMSESEEFGVHQGLDIVVGRVKRLSEPEPAGVFYKIPHVGWNSLLMPSFVKKGQNRGFSVDSYWDRTPLAGLKEENFVYFVHSYVVVPDDSDAILTETEYGATGFCSALRQENVFGCQFHPELSGKIGLHILKNFLSAS